jgi:hypothetical protein
MKQIYKTKCPNCGSEEFITHPNRYDCLVFVNGQFNVEKSEFINEGERIFCRKCSAEIDEKASVKDKKVVLRITRNMC